MAGNSQMEAQLTLDGVIDKINFGSQQISNKNYMNIVSKQKNNFQQKIKAVQDVEKSFFTALGFKKGTPEENLKALRERVEECRKMEHLLIDRMTGSGLKELIDETSKKIEDQSENTRFLQALFEEEYDRQNIDGKIEEWTQEEAIEAIFNSFDDNGLLKKYKKGGRRSKIQVEKYSGKGSYKDLTFEVLSNAEKERLLYIKKGYEAGEYNDLRVKINMPKSNEVMVSLKYKDNKGLGQGGILQKRFELYNVIVEWLNRGGGLTAEMKRCCIDVLFSPDSIEDLSAFFYGKNYSNGLTGLLGEIMGLYYLRTVLNQNVEYTKGTSSYWQGGLRTGGKQPHEDIIFQDQVRQLYGIQIKNTGLDEVLKGFEGTGRVIGFTSRSFYSFMDQIESLASNVTGLKLPDIDAFKEIYTMKAFNDTYEDSFAPVRQGIETLASRADKIISLFVDTLLYLQTSLSATNLAPGNIVFFLGGSTLVMASEIMIEIYDNLENLQNSSFQVIPYFSTKKTKNKGKSYSSYSKYREDNNEINADTIPGKLKLTSAFRFDENIMDIYNKNRY